MNAPSAPTRSAVGKAAMWTKLSCESRIIHQIWLTVPPPRLGHPPGSLFNVLLSVRLKVRRRVNDPFWVQFVTGAQQPRSERWAEAAEPSHPLEHPPLPRWNAALGSLQGECTHTSRHTRNSQTGCWLTMLMTPPHHHHHPVAGSSIAQTVVVPLCIIFIVFTSHCCSIMVPAGGPRPQLGLHVGSGSGRPELRATKGHVHGAADPLPAPVAHPARPVAALGPLQHPVGLLHHPSVTAGSQPDQSQSGDNPSLTCIACRELCKCFCFLNKIYGKMFYVVYIFNPFKFFFFLTSYTFFSSIQKKCNNLWEQQSCDRCHTVDVFRLCLFSSCAFTRTLSVNKCKVSEVQ